MPEPIPLYVVHDSREDGDDMEPTSFHTSRRDAIDRIDIAEDNGIDTLSITKIQVPIEAEPLKDFLDEVSYWEGLFDGDRYAIPEYGT